MKLFLEKLGVSCLHFLTLLVATFLVLWFQGKQDYFFNFDFIYFDSIHYESIKNGQYEGWLVAFFPGFPFLWRILDLSPGGISIFNSLLFIISASFLASKLELSNWKYLLYLTMPSIIFIALPYSESLFFFCAAGLLLSLKYDLKILVLLAAALCSFTRPVVFVFIPAFTIMIGINYYQSKKISTSYLLGLVGIVLGLILAFFVQYLSSGIWFEFFQAQSTGWGNALQLPKLPLSSWSGNFITAIDGVSLWVSLIFLYWVIHENFQKIFRKKSISELSSLEEFCLLIIGGTGLLILFTRGGMLFSLNRFIFLSPCYLVALNALSRFKPSRLQITYIVLSIITFSLLLGSYGHIRSMLIYLGLAISIGISIWIVTYETQKLTFRFVALILVLFILQIIVVIRTFNHDWVA